MAWCQSHLPTLIRAVIPAQVTSLCCSVAACDSGRWGPAAATPATAVQVMGLRRRQAACVCVKPAMWARSAEERESGRPHAHACSCAHTPVSSRTHTHTHTYKCQGTQPCSLSPVQQRSPRPRPPPTSPIWLPCHPRHPPTCLGSSERPMWSKGSEMGSITPPGGACHPVRGEKCLLGPRGPCPSVSTPPGWAGGSGVSWRGAPS